MLARRAVLRQYYLLKVSGVGAACHQGQIGALTQKGTNTSNQIIPIQINQPAELGGRAVIELSFGEVVYSCPEIGFVGRPSFLSSDGSVRRSVNNED